MAEGTYDQLWDVAWDQAGGDGPTADLEQPQWALHGSRGVEAEGDAHVVSVECRQGVGCQRHLEHESTWIAIGVVVDHCGVDPHPIHRGGRIVEGVVVEKFVAADGHAAHIAPSQGCSTRVHG